MTSQYVTSRKWVFHVNGSSTRTVSTKIYDQRDDFDFDIVDFPFLDGDVPRRSAYSVYLFEAIRSARVSSHAITQTSPYVLYPKFHPFI